MEPAQPPEQVALGENIPRQHGAAAPGVPMAFWPYQSSAQKNPKKAKEQM